MKKKHIQSLQLNKVKITKLQSKSSKGGVFENNYTRANGERSRPLSICHGNTATVTPD